MRDRLIADPRYCFIVLAEVAIDSGCATVAEAPTPPNPTRGGSEFALCCR